MRQRALNIPGLDHPMGVPLACRIGNVVHTSAVLGKDPDTGEMPPDADSQARNCFATLLRVLQIGRMDFGDVVKITIFVRDDADRDVVFKYWRQHFPDPTHMPARHTLVQPLHSGMLVQLEALAVARDA